MSLCFIACIHQESILEQTVFVIHYIRRSANNGFLVTVSDLIDRLSFCSIYNMKNAHVKITFQKYKKTKNLTKTELEFNLHVHPFS